MPTNVQNFGVLQSPLPFSYNSSPIFFLCNSHFRNTSSFKHHLLGKGGKTPINCEDLVGNGTKLVNTEENITQLIVSDPTFDGYYISCDGTDVEECGVLGNPCRSVQYILKVKEPHLKMTSLSCTKGPYSINNCMDIIVNTYLPITLIGTDNALLGCTPDEEFLLQKLVAIHVTSLNIGNKIEISNMFVRNTEIIFSNINGIDIQNTTFANSSIALTAKGSSQIRQSPFYIILNNVIFTNAKKSFDCSDETVISMKMDIGNKADIHFTDVDMSSLSSENVHGISLNIERFKKAKESKTATERPKIVLAISSSKFHHLQRGVQVEFAPTEQHLVTDTVVNIKDTLFHRNQQGLHFIGPLHEFSLKWTNFTENNNPNEGSTDIKKGAAVFIKDSELNAKAGNGKYIFETCYFDKNFAKDKGAAMYLQNLAQVTITSVNFTSNIAPFSGGAIFGARLDGVAITNVRFIGASRSSQEGTLFHLNTRKLKTSNVILQSNNENEESSVMVIDKKHLVTSDYNGLNDLKLVCPPGYNYEKQAAVEWRSILSADGNRVDTQQV